MLLDNDNSSHTEATGEKPWQPTLLRLSWIQNQSLRFSRNLSSGWDSGPARF